MSTCHGRQFLPLVIIFVGKASQVCKVTWLVSIFSTKLKYVSVWLTCHSQKLTLTMINDIKWQHVIIVINLTFFLFRDTKCLPGRVRLIFICHQKKKRHYVTYLSFSKIQLNCHQMTTCHYYRKSYISWLSLHGNNNRYSLD